MPLIIPTLDPIEDLHQLIGKRLLDEELVTDRSTDPSFLVLLNPDGSVNPNRVVFKAQLPKNALVLSQDTDRVSITGALKSGFVPIIIDEKDYIVKVY